MALLGKTSEKSIPSSEFVSNIEILNAFVDVGDFNTELEQLELNHKETMQG